MSNTNTQSEISSKASSENIILQEDANPVEIDPNNLPDDNLIPDGNDAPEREPLTDDESAPEKKPDVGDDPIDPESTEPSLRNNKYDDTGGGSIA